MPCRVDFSWHDTFHIILQIHLVDEQKALRFSDQMNQSTHRHHCSWIVPEATYSLTIPRLLAVSQRESLLSSPKGQLLGGETYAVDQEAIPVRCNQRSRFDGLSAILGVRHPDRPFGPDVQSLHLGGQQHADGLGRCYPGQGPYQ